MNRYVGGIALLAAIFGFAFGVAQWVDSLGGPEAFVERYGAAAPLISVPVHAVLAATPFPSELFGMASGAAYGLVLGCVFAWAGWTLGASLEYEVVRRGTRDWQIDSRLSRLPRWLGSFPVAHPVFLIVGRQLPAGYHIVNVAAGAARIPRWRHAWCLAVGNVPTAIVFAAAGAGIRLLG